MATCTAWSILSCRWYWVIRLASTDALVAGTSAGSAEQGLGQLVQPELVHLAGQADLGLGVEPEAEEPLGRLASAVDVPGPHGHPQRHLLAAHEAPVIQRLDGVDDRQRSRIIGLLLHQLGQVEPEVGLGRERPRRPWSARRSPRPCRRSTRGSSSGPAGDSSPRRGWWPRRPGGGNGRPGRSGGRRDCRSRTPAGAPGSRSVSRYSFTWGKSIENGSVRRAASRSSGTYRTPSDAIDADRARQARDEARGRLPLELPPGRGQVEVEQSEDVGVRLAVGAGAHPLAHRQARAAGTMNEPLVKSDWDRPAWSRS